MRRLLRFGVATALLAVAGAVGLALVRRALGDRPAGTPTSWPQVPRREAA